VSESAISSHGNPPRCELGRCGFPVRETRENPCAGRHNFHCWNAIPLAEGLRHCPCRSGPGVYTANDRVRSMTACTRAGKRSICGCAAVVCLALTACNSSGSRQSGTAPNMNGDSMPTMRNVADPNAPFTLRPQAPHLAKRQPVLDVNGVPVCVESQLSLFESRSRLNGNRHTLQLTFENQSAACRLSGFPAVTFLSADGTVLSGIAIQKESAEALAGWLKPQPAAGQPGASQQSGAPGVQPSAEVLLPPRGDAVFELGWTSGSECPQVSRLAVSAPGNTVPSYIPRQLAVCDQQILMTAVAPGGSE
jgi:hypothetical protein